MPKRPRAYYRPQTLADALRHLQEPDTVPLGGGSKLLAGDVTSAVVDLQDLGLDQIECEEGQLLVGATARLSDLLAFAETAESDGSPAALLAQVVRQAGPNTYRNAATLGGSIAARLAESEMLALLLALDAEVQLADDRVMSLPAFWSAQGTDLICTVRLPWSIGRGASERVARTPADTPIVSVTLWQPAGAAPRLAATGIDTLPVRLTQAEAVLAQGVGEENLAVAAAAAESACRHPGDFRGSAAYRRDMVGVLLRRAVRALPAG